MKRKSKNSKQQQVTAGGSGAALVAINERIVGERTIQTVNARDLHAFLEVGKDFSNWIKDRIGQYDFTENQDFVCSPVLASEGRGGQNRIDYHITLDMAKELSMVERNEKGKQARQYFIECERKLKDPAFSIPQTYADALQLAADQAKQLALAAPKVKAYEAFLSCKNAMTFNEAAKVLGTGQNRLFQFCRDSGYLIDGGTKHNLPYQEFADRGYFEVREIVIHHSDWSERKSQTLITAAGLDRIRGQIDSYFEECKHKGGAA